MGTKIQGNPHLREYHSFIDLDASTSNAMKGNWAPENGKNLDSFSSYDIEKVRRTILEHESTFRNQLRELHRLHGRQQELMNEIKRRGGGANKDGQLSYLLRPWSLTHSSSPYAAAGPRVSNNAVFPTYNVGFPSDPFVTNADKQAQERLSRSTGLTYNLNNGTNASSSLNLVTKDFFHDSRDWGGKRHPYDDYADKRRIDKQSSTADFFSCKQLASPPSLFAEPRKELSKKAPLETTNTSLSRTKKKIFGVEICEDTSLERDFKNSDRSNHEKPEGSLPWFLKTSRVSGDSKNSYFMNLDSLQSCSKKFFGKDETPDCSGAKPVLDVDPSFEGRDCGENGENGPTNHLRTNGLVSDKGSDELRRCIDLNLSLYEEEALSTTTGIDLEAPPVLDSEVETKKPHQERDEAAAETLVAISSCERNELLSERDTLKWFAELVSSTKEEETVDVIPTDMDYFEFMTLKLEDTKEEPKPLVLTARDEDDKNGYAPARRPRRGQSRRGRHRRDFQRDILPGLATLSRLEVTEDFQAFEELMRGGAHRRNGRGRRRPTAVKARCSVQAEQPVCEGEGRSLAGWGKKTRRLPRQRCNNAFLAFPVRC